MSLRGSNANSRARAGKRNEEPTEDELITALSRTEHLQSLATMAAIVAAALVAAVVLWLYGADAQTRLQEALTAPRSRNS